MTDGGNRRGVTRLANIGILLAVLMVVALNVQLYKFSGSLDLWVVGQEARNAAMEALPISTDYKSDVWMSGGIQHECRTYRKAGQTDAEFTAAHRAAVNSDLQNGFPKDP